MGRLPGTWEGIDIPSGAGKAVRVCPGQTFHFNFKETEAPKANLFFVVLLLDYAYMCLNNNSVI